jgi:hypothetical protein
VPNASVPAAENLTADGTLNSELLATFAAYKQLPESFFTGPLRGTLYYGYLTSTRTYWALANFSLTPAASVQASVNMQDGGDIGIFTRQSGEPWKMTLGSIPFPCPGVLPSAIMTLWGLTSSGACVVASASSPDRTTTNPNTMLNLPAGTYFGTILFFELYLDGTGTIIFEPETVEGTSPPVNSDSDVALSFGPSTTTGFWVGTNPASSHEVAGTFNNTFAEVVKDAMESFTAQPYSGYVIEVAAVPGCAGGCTEANSVTQFNSLTPTSSDPDYTKPPSS